ncbi:MTAP family purine nucleoside phosphorylase [Aquibacillus albus]|uniref:Purine nucleoside phosphorylase n=1 Tax=Aquibacillus albus TaxID=1168171 RepID=A0ABS2MY07_9BACI|nr:MTAP family purine nucleoside phosphorylase [Aquibacillus albus]MBM7570721.1 5'-methylthioadenosine phosphorylase [Aquibacillus albus]
MKVGVIGGTGFYNLLDQVNEMTVDTEYGEILVYQGEHAGKEVYFIPRHGASHDSLAHQVNYKGIITAMTKLGVEKVLGMCAVGSLTLDIPVGGFALLNQFVDVTTKRDNTFGKYSCDMSTPYCPDLRNDFIQSAENLNIYLYHNATYICVDGPRYETSAEIKLYASWGMHVVGMTNATEAALAREAGLCYSVVTMASDIAAGITDTPPDLAMHKKVINENKDKMANLILNAISNVTEDSTCGCKAAYERAIKAREDKLKKAGVAN